MGKQELLAKFYDLDNLLTFNITIPDADWTALKAAEPRGGRCNFAYVGDRFDWYKATSVTITGSKFPAKGTFTTVGIIKKSYCGSFSTSKPSLRLDFTQFNAQNEKPIEDLIGIKSVTLNNCKQDSSYIRQPLGYELFRQAGVPYARCNFAKVVVNGADQGVFLNLEPIKKGFAQHNFNGNDKGNAYELEVGEDIDPDIVKSGRISFEGFTDFKDQKDIKLAADMIKAGGLQALKQIVDYDGFIKLYAMETLLKHWDGFAQSRNNTYIYNDTVAVANPTAANVKLKFIPCGIDQIMQEGRDFQVAAQAIPAQLIRNDNAARAQLFAQIKTFANTIFSRKNHDAVLKPMIDKMEALLATAGASSQGLAGPIGVVRKQLKLIRSGAFQLIGELPQDATMWLSKASGDCIHASVSELIGTAPPATAPQEVYHCPPTGQASDTWVAAPASPGFTSFKNAGTGTWLHADANVKTTGGHPNVYAVHEAPGALAGSEWAVQQAAAPQQWHATGYYVLKSKTTNQWVYFSDTDMTPKGRKEVHQIDSGSDEARVVFLF